eukprot:scaffold48146_cov38-Attheya_sp.AAC.1
MDGRCVSIKKRGNNFETTHWTGIYPVFVNTPYRYVQGADTLNYLMNSCYLSLHYGHRRSVRLAYA